VALRVPAQVPGQVLAQVPGQVPAQVPGTVRRGISGSSGAHVNTLRFLDRGCRPDHHCHLDAVPIPSKMHRLLHRLSRPVDCSILELHRYPSVSSQRESNAHMVLDTRLLILHKCHNPVPIQKAAGTHIHTPAVLLDRDNLVQ
jgi:hypothetical protein